MINIKIISEKIEDVIDFENCLLLANVEKFF